MTLLSPCRKAAQPVSPYGALHLHPLAALPPHRSTGSGKHLLITQGVRVHFHRQPHRPNRQQSDDREHAVRMSGEEHREVERSRGEESGKHCDVEQRGTVLKNRERESREKERESERGGEEIKEMDEIRNVETNRRYERREIMIEKRLRAECAAKKSGGIIGGRF